MHGVHGRLWVLSMLMACQQETWHWRLEHRFPDPQHEVLESSWHLLSLYTSDSEFDLACRPVRSAGRTGWRLTRRLDNTHCVFLLGHSASSRLCVISLSTPKNGQSIKKKPEHRGTLRLLGPPGS